MLATAQALAEVGQPLETDWPYTPDFVSPWSPPALTTAPLIGRMMAGGVAFDDIVISLDQDTPVVLGLVITDAFYRPDAAGLVVERTPDIERGGHAVLAVGYGRNPIGQTAILIRNSWGAAWGQGGHAWLSRDYLARQLHQTATLA